jgi:hypothetical protein
MYRTQDWIATNDADWGVAIEIVDATTNALMDISSSAITFALSVKDPSCDAVVLSASSAAGTITKPTLNSIQWIFTAAQMQTLCPGTTYEVGVTMTTATGTIQIVVGSLAVVDGGF